MQKIPAAEHELLRFTPALAPPRHRGCHKTRSLVSLIWKCDSQISFIGFAGSSKATGILRTKATSNLIMFGSSIHSLETAATSQ